MKIRSFKFVMLTIVMQLSLYSCSQTESNFQQDELIGVWSGLLFQTEAKYDSILVSPLNQPSQAILRKNNKQQIYPLNRTGNTLKFKGDGGLRFDAYLSNNDQSISGIITSDLWAQSLNFQSSQNGWVSTISKPEIIDTDYILYLEFFRDDKGVLQAKIQSNKENRELHFTIEAVEIDGNEIDFEITNNRFGIAAEFDEKSKTLSLTYKNPGGKRNIQLLKLDAQGLVGYKSRQPNQPYQYKIPKSPDSSIQTASLEQVGINLSLIDFMDDINNKEFEHIHSIIITKDKKLVFEEYFHGYTRESLHDIRSAFKSIASLAVVKR